MGIGSTPASSKGAFIDLKKSLLNFVSLFLLSQLRKKKKV